MIGLGTLVNICTILGGSAIGVLLGSRLPQKTNRTVTDALGLITIVLGGLDLKSLGDAGLVKATGQVGPFMVVIFAMLFGTIIGSLAKIEVRLESFGGWIQSKFTRRAAAQNSASQTAASQARDRFVIGFVDASLIFAVGPMAILGALQEGTGLGPNTLVIKAILDGFACIAFAASLGWGVAASSITVGLWQGALTVAAVFAGNFIPASMTAAITATGGILMLAIGIRLLGIKAIAVADMLPALLVAPLLTWLASMVFQK